MKRRHISYLAILGLLVTACASIGNPDGGIFDEIPPKVVDAFPKDRSVMNDKKKISILFDEYIKLQNASEKVIVSPPQIEAANVRADGKKVKIDLYDTLQKNTTYTIDFSDAIEDNNEGNPMGMYTYSFSTGETIDTMEISGTVLNAADLEPIKGIMVGLFPADSTYSDSLFTTQAFSRVSRTNGSGRFTVKGVKPGRYRAFALKDADGNFRFNQKSEIIAFDTTIWSTSCRPDVRMDTIWRDSTHYDSIRVIPYTHFFPDNIVLKAFQEGGQDHHLLKTERLVPECFKVFFTSPADTLPEIKGLNFDESCLYVEHTLKFDTLTYWITDTLFSYAQDTLSLSMTYLDTDTLGKLVPRTDTLDIVPKLTREKQRKERDKKIEDWNKEREKKQKKAKEPLPPEKNPYEITFLEMKGKPAGSLDPNQNVRFTSAEPIAQLDSTKLHFYIKQDSDWIPAPFLFLPETGRSSSYILYAEWEPKKEYRFMADSLAFTSVLGTFTRNIKQEYKVRDTEEFGSLFIHVNLPDSNVIVQILGRSDKPMLEQEIDSLGNADFYYMKPGEYYIRCFIDKNANGQWDTGDYASGLQPEEVFYFPKPLTVKAQWDIEQDWSPRSIETTKQKAKEITKQKPDKEKKVKSKNKQREEDMRNAKSGKSTSSSNGSTGNGKRSATPAGRRQISSNMSL